MKSLLVLVDQPQDWSPYYPTNQVVAIEQYLRDFAETKGYVINLCRDYSYLSTGYYGSLLAEARGGQVFPSVRAIRELNSFESGQPLPLRSGKVLDSVLRKQVGVGEHYTLSIYFGQTEKPELASVARRLFETFAFPVTEVTLTRHQDHVWTIRDIRCLSLDDLDDASQTRFAEALDAFSHKIWRNKRSNKRYKYDLAVLVNPDEELPPSNKGALKSFEKAGRDLGLNVDFITYRDAARIGEYDALFIRETTRVDHHTYAIAQSAENQGLLVIDSPTDIMRCSNKVYLHERLQRFEVDTPKTRLIMGNQPFDVDELIDDLGLPIIVKVPDGSFSIGVEKAKDREQLMECIDRLSKRSAILLLQEFMPTDYDWRIGIMDNQVLYACRYYMAKSHWQIYNHSARSHKSGNADAMAVEKVPRQVIKTALKAAKCMGDGFYGVDLKASGDRVVIIEVNDNPSIDLGVEDLHSGHLLYQQIMGIMLKKLDELNGRR
ncbi:RimK family protein [Thalassolituus sp. LLYu03]|uniref:RimK family protein n=1 Tax=Thalassolituus sp. LLYu03 TaxID=3421656 RepID=UPI003D2B4F3C